MLIILVTLGLLLATGTTWFLYSSMALSWTLDRVRPALPAWLQLGTVEGRLAGPMTLDSLVIERPGLKIRVTGIRLDWRPAALMIGRLHVLDLEATDARLDFKGRTGAPKGPPVKLPASLVPALPVGLDTLTIRHLRVAVPGLPADTLDGRLESESLAWSPRGIRAHRIAMVGRNIHLDGGLRLASLPPFALAGQFDWRLSIGRYPELAGRTTLAGRLSAPKVTQTLSKPARLELTAQGHDLFGQPAVTGQLVLEPLPLNTLDERLAGLSAGANLSFAGRAGQLGVKGRIAAAGPAMPVPLQAQLDSELDGEGLTVQTLTVTPQSGPGTLTASGRIAWRGPHAMRWQGEFSQLHWPADDNGLLLASTGSYRISGDFQALDFQLDGQAGSRADARVSAAGTLALAEGDRRLKATVSWKGLGWPLTGRPEIASGHGEARLAGWLDSYRLTMKAALAALGLPAAAVDLDLKGDRKGFGISRLDGTWLGGRLAGTGRLDWSSGLKARARFSAERLDPGKLNSAVPGSVSLRGGLEFAQTAGRRRLAVTLNSLGGTLRDQPLSGDGGFQLDGGRWSLRNVKLHAGAAHLEANGGPASGLGWTLDIPDLSVLRQHARGRLNSRGQLRTHGNGLSVQARAVADDVAWGGTRAGSLLIEANVDEMGQAASRISVQGRQLAWRALELDTLALNLQGLTSDHRLELQAASPQATLRLAASGRWQQDRWLGQLDDLQMTPVSGGSWRLSAPVAVTLGSGEIDFGKLCLADTDQSLCAHGRWRRQAEFEAGVNGKNIHLADLTRVWTSGVGLEGRLDLDATLSGQPSDWHGTLHSRLRNGRIIRPRSDAPDQVLLTPDHGQLDATADNGRVDARVELGLADSGRVAGRLTIGDAPGGRQDERPLDGELQFDMHNLGLVPLLVPDISRLTGNLRGKVELAGALGKPRVDGNAEFRDGEAGIPRLGMRLKAIRLRAEGDGRQVRLEGQAASGDGTLNVDGELAPGETRLDARLHVGGQNFLAVNMPEARVIASPDLTLTARGRDLDLAGTVTIPRARLRPRDLAGAVAVSPDQQIVGAQAVEKEPRWRLTADVTTRLGDDVDFKGFG
ncbi:MAG: translocation/assembly module TamB domain-containing protein, partial [Gammaproteobacteria bacterium]